MDFLGIRAIYFAALLASLPLLLLAVDSMTVRPVSFSDLMRDCRSSSSGSTTSTSLPDPCATFIRESVQKNHNLESFAILAEQHQRRTICAAPIMAMSDQELAELMLRWERRNRYFRGPADMAITIFAHDELRCS